MDIGIVTIWFLIVSTVAMPRTRADQCFATREDCMTVGKAMMPRDLKRGTGWVFTCRSWQIG